MSSVWPTFRRYFEDDDGSLPGVGVAGLAPAELGAAFDLLSTLGVLQHEAAGTLPDRHRKRKDAGPNAAVLVASGQIAPFHGVMSGASFRGVPIPDLGVSVFDDAIVLDYRRGPDWNARSVGAFLGLLSRLMSLGQGARLEFDSAFDGEFAAALARDWDRLQPDIARLEFGEQGNSQ